MKTVSISKGRRKSKAEAAAEKAAEIARRAAVVDEFGRLSAEVAAVEPSRKRLEVLKREIAGWADKEFPADQPVMFEGKIYAAQVSAKGNKRRITSMERLFEALGKVKFLAACGFTLKAAEEHLPKSQLAEVVVEDENVGERTVKAMVRAAAAAPEAA